MNKKDVIKAALDNAEIQEGLTMTNAEWIRQATDEELAAFLNDYVEPCMLCAWRKTCSDNDCEKGRLAWLREDWKG